MISFTPLIYLTGVWQTGALRGKVHNFNIGEGLPVHSHVNGQNNHITIILNGRFVCSGNPAIDGQIIKVGDVLDWMPDEPHGFTALENNSSLIQVAK
jgi:quercetin dioxygenase-like cupin family protein